MALLNSTGGRIKLARNGRGWTQQELADRLNDAGAKGASRSNVAGWETNNSMPSVDALRALASLLATSMDYLTMATDDPSPSTIDPTHLLVTTRDAAERDLYEEWMEILEDVDDNSRRPLMRTVRLLASQFNSSMSAGNREDMVASLFDVLWRTGGDAAVEQAIKDLRKSVPDVSSGLSSVLRLRRKEIKNYSE